MGDEIKYDSLGSKLDSLGKSVKSAKDDEAKKAEAAKK